MAFTFLQSNTANTIDALDLQISINPTAAIFSSVVLDANGTAVAGTSPITISNIGAVKANVSLTAEWGPVTPTTPQQATLLANVVGVDVSVSSAGSNPVYSGKLINLNTTSITGISAGSNDVIAISISIPTSISGPTLVDKLLTTDFVFIATSA